MSNSTNEILTRVPVLDHIRGGGIPQGITLGDFYLFHGSYNSPWCTVGKTMLMGGDVPTRKTTLMKGFELPESPLVELGRRKF